MSQMEFFRSPQLLGNNVTRLTNATVRGNVRRSDPDGTSSVPYFPGVSGSQTILISIDGASAVSVTLSGNSINGIISDINTALGSTGTAFDADGTLAIKTNTTGGGGSVEVTGGTASVAIGFDTSKVPFKSVGGDVPSSPEGRIGNPFGTATPAPKETLSVDSVNRALTRISANADVLYSDVSRQDGKLQFIGSLSFSRISGHATYATTTLPSACLNGLGELSRTSTAKDIGKYFMLVDPTTGQPSPSKVVAVVNGSPTGIPPYADTLSASAADGGNMLGLDLVKSSSIAISGISNGKVVTLGSAATCAVGDFVSITGATNLTPWNNNGYRWVVEQVIDTTHIALRPMSKAELALVGTTVSDVQPVVSLNSNINGGQSFGTLSVRSGNKLSAGAPTLVISPPAAGALDVWAVAPMSLRDNSPHGDAHSNVLGAMGASDTLDPMFNGILSGMSSAYATTTVSIAAGTIRHHGKVYSIPSSSVDITGLANGKYYVYFDVSEFQYKTTTDITTIVGLSSNGHIVGILTLPYSGNYVSLQRPVSDTARSITVGPQGQFSSLSAAATYISNVSAGYSESTYNSGNYGHWDIVITGALTEASPSFFTCPWVRIRGRGGKQRINVSGVVGPAINLNFNFTGAEVQNLILEDLEFVGASSYALIQNSAILNLTVNRVNTVTSSVGSLVTSVNYGHAPWNSVNDLRIFDSSISFQGNLIASGTNGGETHSIYRSSLTCTGTTGGSLISGSPVTPGTLWVGNTCIIDACTIAFNTVYASQTYPLIGNFNNGSIGRLALTRNTLTFGTFSSTTATLFGGLPTATVLERNVIGTAANPAPVFISSTNANCNVALNSNSIYLKSGSAGAMIISGGTLQMSGNVIVGDSVSSGSVLQMPSNSFATGNSVGGNGGLTINGYGQGNSWQSNTTIAVGPGNHSSSNFNGVATLGSSSTTSCSFSACTFQNYITIIGTVALDGCTVLKQVKDSSSITCNPLFSNSVFSGGIQLRRSRKVNITGCQISSSTISSDDHAGLALYNDDNSTATFVEIIGNQFIVDPSSVTTSVFAASGIVITNNPWYKVKISNNFFSVKGSTPTSGSVAISYSCIASAVLHESTITGNTGEIANDAVVNGETHSFYYLQLSGGSNLLIGSNLFYRTDFGSPPTTTVTSGTVNSVTVGQGGTTLVTGGAVVNLT
jgi:hypothetical protein